MAYVGATTLTLVDWAKLQDPNNQQARVVELLSQTNPILEDMLWLEGNLPTGHQTTLRTSLPEAQWRVLNYGVQTGKSTAAQITDTCGMLETYSEVDIDLAMLNGNTRQFRLSEDRAFIEGINQQQARTLFYGNANVNPERYTGLAPRYATADATVDLSGNQVIDAGGTGSTNASIWMVVWGDDTVHGIYPKGSQAGLTVRDLGEDTAIDPEGGKYQVYRTRFQWKCGLTVRDYRYIVRIANIDVSTLRGGSAPDLVDLMASAMLSVPSMSMGRPVFYLNRTVASAYNRQARTAPGLQIAREQVGGMIYSDFQGVPMKVVDVLLNTEARVV